MEAENINGTHLPDAYQDFMKSMNDDLDTPKALAVFLEWMKKTKKILIQKKLMKKI